MIRRAVLLALAVVLTAPVLAVAGKRWPSAGRPFTVHVVDETGSPVAGASVIADNGLVCHSDGNGNTRWTESSVMHRSVRFTTERPSFMTISQTLSVTHGGIATVTLARP